MSDAGIVEAGALPSGWHRRMSRQLFGLVSNQVTVATLLLAIAAVLLWGKPETSAARVLLILLVAAAAVASLGVIVRVLLLVRTAPSPGPAAGLLVPASGLSLLILITAAELVIGDMAVIVRVAHAGIALIAAVLLVLGVPFGARAGRAMLRDLGISDPGLAKAGRRGAIAVGVALAAGIAISFLPLLFEHATPRDCAIRTAGVGAVALVIPLLVAAWLTLRLARAVTRSARATPLCPLCGYRRAVGTRCPECGTDPLSLP